MKAYIYLYMDKKNQPNKKAALTYDMDITKSASNAKANSVAKLSAPGLPKDLVVKFESDMDFKTNNGLYKLVVDIFANPNQKLVATLKYRISKDEEKGYSSWANLEMKSPVSILYICINNIG